MKNYSPLLDNTLRSLFTPNHYTEYLKLLALTYHKRTTGETHLDEFWRFFDYDLLLESVVAASIAPIRFIEDNISGRGYYHAGENIVYISSQQTTVSTLAVTIQGLSYSRLYQISPSDKDTLLVNFEAECVAFTTSYYFGLDTNINTSVQTERIQSLSALEISESLSTIQSISFDLISRIMKIYSQAKELRRKSGVTKGNIGLMPIKSITEDISIVLPAKPNVRLNREYDGGSI